MRPLALACSRRGIALLASALVALLALTALNAAGAQQSSTGRSDSTTRSTTSSTGTSGKEGGSPGTPPGTVSPMIGGSAYLDVEPKGGTISGPSSGTMSTSFTVQNTGTGSTTGSFTIRSDGAISGCSVSPTSASMAVGASKTLAVSCATAVTGSGNIYVDAGWPSANSDEGYVTVQLPSAQPALTASPTTQYTAENVSTNYPGFQLTNTGTATGTYTATVTNCSGSISGCAVHAQPSPVGVNGSTTLQVDYQSGYAPGTGTITLQVTSQYGETSSASVTVADMSEAVSVTPDGGTATLGQNGTLALPFTVHETGNSGSGFRYTLRVACSGAVVTCVFPGTGVDTTSLPPNPGVDQNTSVNVVATSSLAGGTGPVTLTASYTNSWGQIYQDAGSYTITVPDARTYTVQVTPDGATGYAEQHWATSYAFTVADTGNTSATYSLSIPTCTGVAGGTSCSFSASSSVSTTTVNVGAKASTVVPVYYTTGPAGQSASLDLHAAGPANSDDGTATIVPLTDTVLVTTADGTVETGSTGTIPFHVQNLGNNGTVTYSLQVTACTGALVTNSCTAPGVIAVAQGADSIVNVSVQGTTTPGSGSVTLRAYKQIANLYQSSATSTVTVQSPLSVSLPFMTNDNQNVSLCAASCFSMTTARRTVPYFTLDAARSVTLVYNGDRAFPRPFVYADVWIPVPPAPVQNFTLEVQRNGVDLPFVNGETKLTFQGTTQKVRLAGQIDLSSYTTGSYPVSIVVTAVYDGHANDVTSVTTNLLVVNTHSSPIGRGWTVAGVPRLYPQADGSALIVDGTGSAVLFTPDGSGGYVKPSGDYTTLASRAGGGWVRAGVDSTKVWFNASGLADSVTDRLDFSTRFDYDGSARLSHIYDPMLVRSAPGRAATTLTYGAYGLASIQEPNPIASAGRITQVHVTSDSLLRAIVDPDNDSTAYGYDGSQRLHTITDRNGNTTTYDYGASWKLAQVTSPAVPIDAGGGSTAMAQPTLVFQPWQAVGVPFSATDVTPAPCVRADTVYGRVTDPLGYTTRFTVDRWGQPLAATDPVGNVTTYYRSGVMLEGQSIPDGNRSAGVSAYEYAGPLVTMAQVPGSDTVYYHYGVAAQLDSTWGLGTVFEHRFLRADGRADSVGIAHDSLRVTRYAYDAATARVATVTDPAGHVTRYAYDPIFGNTVQVIAPGGRSQTVRLDAYGRDTATLAPGVAAHVTQLDVVNRAVFDSVAGNSGATRMAYFHDHSTVTDALGQAYRTDFDALGRTTASHHPDATLAPVTYRYDRAGHLTSTTNRRGQRIDVTYDALGRMLTRDDPVSGLTTFHYSPGGLMAVDSNATVKDSSIVSPSCATGQYSVSSTCTADTTFVTFAGKTYTLGHVTPGQLTADETTGLDDAGATSKRFTWNARLGTPNSVTLDPLTMSYGYDAKDGLNTTTTLPGLDVQTDSFTTAHQAYTWTFSDSVNANPLYRRAERFDTLRRIVFEQMGYPYQSVATSYQLNRAVAYDTLGHLTQVDWSYQSCMAWPGSNADSLSQDLGWRYRCTPTPIFSEGYSYDAVGNRTDYGMAGHYAAGNRLTMSTSAAYEYDADGNLIRRTDATTGQVRQFYWDAENQLDSVLVSGGGVASFRVDYRYDPAGRLVWRSASGAPRGDGQRFYLYDGDDVGKEVDLVTGNTTEYAYAGVDRPIMAVVRNSSGTVLQTRTYMQDGLGSVVGSVGDSSTGAAVIYDSWGNIETDSTAVARLDTLRFGFKGMLYDESLGLYNARARWYDPDVGRFLSEDPVGLTGGMSLYGFAGTDPINASDPSGLAEQATSYGTCTIAAATCGDALQFPGTAHYVAEVGGGVSFAGGVSVATPVKGYSKGTVTYIQYSDGTVEVRAGGDPNWRNNNPGNLRPDDRSGTFVNAIAAMFGAIGVTQSDFFIFPSYDAGWLALYGVLSAANKSQTIGELIHRYAPWTDSNNPDAYTRTVQSLTGFSASTRLGSLDGSDLFTIATAIQAVEGKKVGTVTYIHP